MKKQIINAVRIILRDRFLAILLGVFLLGCLSLLVYLGLSIHSSELQVVVHYTGFGSTNFYRDKWYYLVSFALFVVCIALLHPALTYKILQLKGRPLAVAFAWLSLIIVMITTLLLYQILKIASLS
jgi:hypothetical protein